MLFAVDLSQLDKLESRPSRLKSTQATVDLSRFGVFAYQLSEQLRDVFTIKGPDEDPQFFSFFDS